MAGKDFSVAREGPKKIVLAFGVKGRYIVILARERE
jgi:hypothetical protein